MCDVNTRLAHRQMKMFCCASGEAVSDWGEACRKVSNGTWQAAMIHHVHNEARNERCHHPVCNRQQQRMGHIHHFWQHATPRNFYLISSDNFIITFLSCIAWLATTWCPCSAQSQIKKSDCERIVLFMQYPLISVKKYVNEYVRIYTKSSVNDFVQATKLHHVITVACSGFHF